MRKINSIQEAEAEMRTILFNQLTCCFTEMPQAEALSILKDSLHATGIKPKIFFGFVHNIGMGDAPEHTVRLKKFATSISDLREKDILESRDKGDMRKTRLYHFRRIFIDEGRIAMDKEIEDIIRSL